MDVENELREAMSDTTKEEGKLVQTKNLALLKVVETSASWLIEKLTSCNTDLFMVVLCMQKNNQIKKIIHKKN